MAGMSERAARLNGNITARRQRSSERLLQNLADALPRDRKKPTLKQEQARGGIPASRGEVRRDYQPGTGNTENRTGIAGPLIEGGAAPAPDPENPDEDTSATPASDREYYDSVINQYSNAYLIAVEIQPLKTLKMRDANGNEVVFEYALPPEMGDV